MNINILQKFSKKNYFTYPFPNFEINNCLPEKIYDILYKEYSQFLEYFKSHKDFEANNVRLQISSEEFLNNKNFKCSLWNEFIIYHTSSEFLKNIIEIFYDDLLKYFPDISFDNNKIQNCGIRNLIDNRKKDFVLDCQPGINTKVKKSKSVRGPHIDNPHELIGGLFYLSDITDKDGGDLEIYESNKEIIFHKKAEVFNLNDLKHYKTVKYKKNNVFFFINSVNSIHSVTKRNVTNHYRKLTNIIVERYTDGYNFQIPRKESLISKIFKKIYK